MTPVFVQKWWVAGLCQNGPPIVKMVATGCNRSLYLTQKPWTGNWTTHQRAWTATTVWFKSVAVQSSCQFFWFFWFFWTRLLNTNDTSFLYFHKINCFTIHKQKVGEADPASTWHHMKVQMDSHRAVHLTTHLFTTPSKAPKNTSTEKGAADHHKHLS